jgi:hypothetical protein
MQDEQTTADGPTTAAGTTWLWVAAAIALLAGLLMFASGSWFAGHFAFDPTLAKLVSPFFALFVLDVALAVGATRSTRRPVVTGCLIGTTLATIAAAVAVWWFAGYLVAAIVLLLPLVPAWREADR